MSPEEKDFLSAQIGGLLAATFLTDDANDVDDPDLQNALKLALQIQTIKDVPDILTLSSALEPLNPHGKLSSPLIDGLIFTAKAIKTKDEEDEKSQMKRKKKMKRWKNQSLDRKPFTKAFKKAAKEYNVDALNFLWNRWPGKIAVFSGVDAWIDTLSEESKTPFNRRGFLATFEWFLSMKTLHPIWFRRSWTELFMAYSAKNGDIEMLQAYVCLFPETSFWDGHIIMAVEHNFLAGVELMLKQNQAARGGAPGALKIATEALLFVQSPEMIAVLVRHGGLPLMCTGVMHEVIRRDQLNLFLALKELGGNPAVLLEGLSVMCTAVKENHLHLIEKLKTEGVPIRIVNADEVNPLSWARTPEMFMHLLQQKATVTRLLLVDSAKHDMPLNVLHLLMGIPNIVSFFQWKVTIRVQKGVLTETKQVPELDVAISTYSQVNTENARKCIEFLVNLTAKTPIKVVS